MGTGFFLGIGFWWGLPLMRPLLKWRSGLPGSKTFSPILFVDFFPDRIYSGLITEKGGGPDK